VAFVVKFLTFSFFIVYFEQEDGWPNHMKCINARRLTADIYMTRTVEIAEEKSPKAPSLMICRTTGNVRYAAPVKKCLSRLAEAV
jgi:hypothetical protein